MDYTIYPFEGVGPIKFGMTPQQVREVVGEPDESFMKGESEFPTDVYDRLGFRIEYEYPGVCDEIWLLADGCNPIFQGHELGGQTFEELKYWFQKLGTPVQHFGYGFTFLKFGIYLYSHDYIYEGDNPNPPELIAVCSAINIDKALAAEDDGYPTEEAISV